MNTYINKNAEEHSTYQTMKELSEKIENYTGHFYIGYPISNLDDKSETFIGLLLIQDKGIYCFTSNQVNKFESMRYLDSLIAKDKNIYTKKDSLVFYFDVLKLNNSDLIDYVTAKISSDHQDFPLSELEKFSSIIQNIYTLRKVDKRLINSSDSLGSFIKEKNEKYKILDIEQFEYIHSKIHSHTRIRGLAGSGKTIIMVRKMAQLHYYDPDKVIVYSFYSKSLKEFIIELFYKAFDELSNRQPNMKNIKIMHAWGTGSHTGTYREICLHNGISPMPYKYFDSPYPNTFTESCSTALTTIKEFKPQFDYIFLDESQDFPLPFFHLCLNSLNTGGKLIYAYDELQNFGRNNMPTKDEIFIDKRVKDVNLDRCYRTPIELLVPAHAFGMGIYNGMNKLYNFVDDDALWMAIGYKLQSGKLIGGVDVSLHRKYEMEEKLNLQRYAPIEILSFENVDDQYTSAANFIKQIIETEDILPEDILIIDFDSYNFDKNYHSFNYALNKQNVSINYNQIKSNLVNKDSEITFRLKNSIPYTSIFRAKGNEASIVLIMNIGEFNSLESYWRKQLFTAITRSKIIARLYGIGEKVQQLNQELSECIENKYGLNFKYPTEKEKQQIDTIAKKEQKTVEDIVKTTDIFQTIQKNDKNVAREMLLKQLGSDSKEDLLKKIAELFDESKKDSN